MGLSKRLNELRAKQLQAQEQEQPKLAAVGTTFKLTEPPDHVKDQTEQIRAFTNRYSPEIADIWYRHGCDPKMVGCLVYDAGTVVSFLSNVEEFILHLREGAQQGVVLYREYMDDQLRSIPEGPGKRFALYVSYTPPSGASVAAVVYITTSRGD